MDKNKFAVTPSMGWNSYDYYNTAVTEDEVRANAQFMAEHLKKYGWEYIVVDIEWYSNDAGTKPQFQYIPFGDDEMDAYGRLILSPNRFPSAKDGKGFKPLADYVHNLGLEFGIHIMRGIPRAAAHKHCPVLGCDATADMVADLSSICGWNPDMYGVRATEAGQAYRCEDAAVWCSRNQESGNPQHEPHIFHQPQSDGIEYGNIRRNL